MSEARTLDVANTGHEVSLRRRNAFLKWQCRVRQMAMRTAGGRPDAAIRPAVVLPDGSAPGRITTILLKRPAFSVTPEFRHMVSRTHDPAERREAAVRFLSASHYQRAEEFSDELAATFAPGAAFVEAVSRTWRCRLVYDAFSQGFDLACSVRLHGAHDPFREAAYWHNKLFNSELHPDTVVLGFLPDWEHSKAAPEPAWGRATADRQAGRVMNEERTRI